MTEYYAITNRCYRCGAEENFSSVEQQIRAWEIDSWVTVQGVPGMICADCCTVITPVQDAMQNECAEKIKTEIEAHRAGRVRRKVMEIVN